MDLFSSVNATANPPRATAPAGETASQRRKREDDADILAGHAAGETPETIAEGLGLLPSHVARRIRQLAERRQDTP